jgi:hypothetical protein
MTTPNSAAVRSAATSAWAWPLNVNRFRRRDRLSQDESDALQGLGFDLLRLDRDRDHPGWQAILRLTAPLDETLAVLHWHPDTVFQRRFARYATAIVLHHCGELGTDFWSWSTREWTDLLRPQQLRSDSRASSACRHVPICSPMPICLLGSPPSTLLGRSRDIRWRSAHSVPTSLSRRSNPFARCWLVGDTAPRIWSR